MTPVKSRLILSPVEYVILTREATDSKPVEIAFGGYLLPIPENEWAFKRIGELRGVDLEKVGYERIVPK